LLGGAVPAGEEPGVRPGGQLKASMRPALATVCSAFTQNTNIVFVFAWRGGARW
jgi:hypothetical protein